MNYRTTSNYRQFNELYDIQTGEDPKGVTKTVPDQSIPLKEIIARSRTGQHVPELDGRYDSDLSEWNQNQPDLTKMSKTDIIDYHRGLTDVIKESRKALSIINKQKQNANANSGIKNTNTEAEANQKNPQATTKE